MKENAKMLRCSCRLYHGGIVNRQKSVGGGYARHPRRWQTPAREKSEGEEEVGRQSYIGDRRDDTYGGSSSTLDGMYRLAAFRTGLVQREFRG